MTTKAQWDIDQTGKKWTYGPECSVALWSLVCSNAIPWTAGEDGWWNGWDSWQTPAGPEYLLRQMHESGSCTNKNDYVEITPKSFANSGVNHHMLCYGIRPQNVVTTITESETTVLKPVGNFGAADCDGNTCHESAEKCAEFCSETKFFDNAPSGICNHWIYAINDPISATHRCNIGGLFPTEFMELEYDDFWNRWTYGSLASSGYVISNERTTEFHEGFWLFNMEVQYFNKMENKKLQYENDVVTSKLVRNGKLQSIQKHDCNLVEYEEVTYESSSSHIMEVSNHLETCGFGNIYIYIYII